MRKFALLVALLLLSCARPQTLRTAALVQPDQYASLDYSFCSNEFQTCSFSGTKVVRFGAGGKYIYKVYTNSVSCRYDVIGDPAPGASKQCYVSSVDPTTFTPPVTDAGQTTCSCPCQTVDAGAPVDSGAKKDSSVVDSGTTVNDAGRPDSGADAGSIVPRPATSKGVGFYVVGSRVYDANGNEFRIRGTNKTHQDVQAPGLGKTKSNATRWIIYFVDDPNRAVRDLQSASIGGTTTNGKAVQIPGFWDGTCQSDSASFSTMVDRWVRDAAVYQTIEKFTIINVANEWGNDEAAWRDAYVAALPKIRAAGWHGLIMVDAPGCGQNGMAIARQGAAILAADPERNVLFDWHVYGNVFDSQGGIARQWAEQVDLVPTMDALVSSGLAAVVGEFGPGRNIGPSPTMLTPQRLVSVAEAHGIGFMSWSWEDNDLSGAMCSDNGFCHTFDPSKDPTPSNLTTYGSVMVPLWEQLAKPATIFN